MALVTIRAHTLAQFEQYLRRQMAYRGPRATFLHHCWRPNTAQYHGLSTIEGTRRYHLSHGFSEIAANCYTGPDGVIFNARPLSMSNWAHAYVRRSWADVKNRSGLLHNLCAGKRGWPNRYGFGIETVGDFDQEDPTSSRAMETSLDVLAIVHRLWDIPAERCFFHRDVAHKTCPGTRVSRSWVHAELKRRLNEDPLRVVLLPGSDVIDCRPAIEAGTTRCDLRGLGEGLGYDVIADQLDEDNIIYIREED